MSDPSLATLVPTSTTRRNVVLVVAALLALVLAAASPLVLRPRMFDDGWGGMTGAAEDRTLTIVYQAVPRVWPGATIAEVVAPPGTHVLGAWAAETADVTAALVGQGPPAARAAVWQDAMDGSFPAALRAPANALPRQVRGGTDLTLAVVYRIDDCTQATAPQAPEDDEPVDLPFLRWRTVLGTTTTTNVPRDGGPTGSIAVDALRELGVCP
ncbi:hypothetical protein [Xylanimonas protaetiae]|uniref:Uncharacterized protein n=1 Tax=Xylanimonas protaetiae TaxID=2509457 RepID=A0A4P6FIS1_9MICO|nr:hypothetical protein [Xylanimonas protaetiae]QAY70458.1 hypothetical protein ET471_10815 [Xylanimonas protaetiae]